MALDRKGIVKAFVDLLKSDTSVLYGSGKLLNIINDKSIKFAKSRVNNKKPFGLYVWCVDETISMYRMQNNDEIYELNFRYEAIAADPETAVQQIDDANERVKLLANLQMYNGQMMSAYYTDSNAQVININPINSSLPAPESTEEKKTIIEIESAIEIEINRYR